MVVSQNMNRLFDDRHNGHKEKVLSAKTYHKRLQQLATKIATEFEFAHVIAFQEVENKTILEDLAKLLQVKFNRHYRAILEEGNDVSGIDVGFLVRHDVRIKSVSTLFQNQTYSGKNVHLFSRPPLLLKVCRTDCVTIMNVHLRSMRGLNSAKTRRKVSLKRKAQAETLARWIDHFQTRKADQYLMVLGDFNALTPSDEYVDMLGTIRGEPDQLRPKWKSPDLVKNNLIDLSRRVPSDARYSYMYKKRKQLLDFLLISSNLERLVIAISYTPIDHNLSDHGALKGTFLLP